MNNKCNYCAEEGGVTLELTEFGGPMFYFCDIKCLYGWLDIDGWDDLKYRKPKGE